MIRAINGVADGCFVVVATESKWREQRRRFALKDEGQRDDRRIRPRPIAARATTSNAVARSQFGFEDGANVGTNQSQEFTLLFGRNRRLRLARRGFLHRFGPNRTVRQSVEDQQERRDNSQTKGKGRRVEVEHLLWV